MNTSNQDLRTASMPPPPDAATVDKAFEALRQYDEGSGRAELLPIDHTIMAALNDEAACRVLEHRLVAALDQGVSDIAREYVCSKLKLIGSAAAVPALAALLDHETLATAARDALESIPDPEATQALRDRLPELEGLSKVGVIQSLGVKRDRTSVRALAHLLEHTDLQIAGSAAAALGEIGSVGAANGLRSFQPRAPDGLQMEVADACLVCADRLQVAGEHDDATRLFRLLNTPDQPGHIRAAASLGLAR